MTATPRPWAYRRGKSGIYIEGPAARVPLWLVAQVSGRGGDMDEANAALIVRAVNAHDDLLEALERVEWALSHGALLDETSEGMVRAAIARARATQEPETEVGS